MGDTGIFSELVGSAVGPPGVLGSLVVSERIRPVMGWVLFFRLLSVATVVDPGRKERGPGK